MLLKKGARVQAYDPVATENMKKLFADIVYCSSPYEALAGADACIVLTEWPEFKVLDLGRMALMMRAKIVVDMRSVLDRDMLENLGFTYDTVGS